MKTFEILPPVRDAAVPVVVHVPHGNVAIPPAYRADFAQDNAGLAGELLATTDRYTDELVEVATALGATIFVNRVSRLVMDPARFANDAGESMAPDDRARRMNALYEPYHAALDELVAAQLARFDRCLIVHLHSFPRVALPHEDASLPRPPICIGFDAFHVDTELRDIWAELANAHGHEVGLNTPFAGSLVPLRFYRADRRVQSLEIELRRDVFMNEATGAKNATFGHTQLLVRALLTAATDQAALSRNGD